MTFTLGVITGITIVVLYNFFNIGNIITYLLPRRFSKVKDNHIPPQYYGYKGGWDNVTVCKDCSRTALYEDQHPVNPCPSCGSTVIQKTGRWLNTHWEVK